MHANFSGGLISDVIIIVGHIALGSYRHLWNDISRRQTEKLRLMKYLLDQEILSLLICNLCCHNYTSRDAGNPFRGFLYGLDVVDQHNKSG